MGDKQSNATESSLSRRSLLQLAGAAVGGLAVLNLGTTSGTAQSGESMYSGTARTDVLVGDGLSTTPHSYQQNVIVVFGPPKQGGLTENNPFNLFVGPANRNETGQPGVFEIHTAVLVGSNVFQYWELQQQDNGTFVGRLTDPHNAEALVTNLINLQTSLIPGRPNLGELTMPKGMAAGTQIVGAVTDSAAEIQLQGLTIDQFTQFSSQIVASRVA